MRRIRIVIASVILAVFSVAGLARPASAGTTYQMFEGGAVPVGCCNPGDTLNVLMSPGVKNGLNWYARCYNLGGMPWVQPNPFRSYTWCLNVSF